MSGPASAPLVAVVALLTLLGGCEHPVVVRSFALLITIHNGAVITTSMSVSSGRAGP